MYLTVLLFCDNHKFKQLNMALMIQNGFEMGSPTHENSPNSGLFKVGLEDFANALENDIFMYNK